MQSRNQGFAGVNVNIIFIQGYKITKQWQSINYSMRFSSQLTYTEFTNFTNFTFNDFYTEVVINTHKMLYIDDT